MNSRRDVIIVGGGTAGSVVARRLSEFYRVSVFEKSNKGRLPYFYQIPLMIGLLFGKRNDFVGQIHLPFKIGRRVPFFESKVLGGSSAMNGCVHVAGSLVKWDALLSKFNLTRQDLIDSYSSLYTKEKEKGKINIRKAQCSELDQIFFEALQQQSIDHGDVEWIAGEESGSVYNTISRIFRSSVASIKPFSRCNVNIKSDVDCLIVDDKFKVKGVVSNNEIQLSDTVILCAGVIGTTLLLKQKALRLSDMCYVDLPLNVGGGIKDHTNLRVNVKSSWKLGSLNEINASPTRKLVLFLMHILGKRTLMQGTGATSAVHLDLDKDGEIDTRIQLLNFTENGRLASDDGDLFSSAAPGFSFSITVINPKSSGSIEIRNGDISINPNYLSNQHDVNHLKNALNFIIDLLRSPLFSCVVDKIEMIGEIESNPEKYIAENAYSGYHLIGGCAHQVGEDFNVPCLDGLYICDASIIPEYISSNIHSGVVLLADMFAKKFIMRKGGAH